MTPPFDVCVVGSANLDLVVRAPRHPRPGETIHGTAYAEHPGGKGLNQAVAAARSGASTAFVGALGTDAAGDLLEGVLRDDSIDATHVARVSAPSGRALIVVDDRGENSIVIVAGANASVEPTATTPRASVVLAQLEIPVDAVIAVFREARARGATTVLNPAPAAALPSALLEVTDVVVPNEHEIDLVGGVGRLHEAGCSTVIVTRGGAGVDVHQVGSPCEHVDAFPVDVVDSTGAGDAFCGALAARLAARHDVLVAVRWAAAAGALATTKPGAVPAQPTASAIRALMSEHDG